MAGTPWLFSFLAPAGVTLAIWGRYSLLRSYRFDIGFSSKRDVLLLSGAGACYLYEVDTIFTPLAG